MGPGRCAVRPGGWWGRMKSVGPARKLSTSCGRCVVVVDSRALKLTASTWLVASTKLYVPSAPTSGRTSYSTHAPVGSAALSSSESFFS